MYYDSRTELPKSCSDWCNDQTSGKEAMEV